MLPTFSKVVAKRAKINREILKHLIYQKSPLLADIPSHIVHEGSTTDMIRVGGELDRTEMNKITGEVDIVRSARSDFTLETVTKYLDEMAEQFARQMTENVLRTVSEAAEASGNVVDGKGQPFSPEMLLRAMESIQLEFSPDGSWKPPTCVATPEQVRRLELFKGTDEHRDYDRKLKLIIERKLSEFRSREAGRILAG